MATYGVNLALLLGLVVSVTVGFQVTWILRVLVDRPANVPKLKIKLGTWLLGVLESVLFFVSAWSGRYELAGGWLVFKVGSKWYAWQHIIKVPEDDRDLTWEQRIEWGSWTTARFLLGTLWNLLAGLLGAYVGRQLLGTC